MASNGKQYLSSLDLKNNTIYNGFLEDIGIEIKTSEPSKPWRTGLVYFNSTLGKIGVYTGINWIYTEPSFEKNTAFNKNFETNSKNIKMNQSAASVGTLNTVARADHVHPTDVTREPAFDKNTAFNKNFGTQEGTVCEGNDQRVLNGQSAYSYIENTVKPHISNNEIHVTKEFKDQIDKDTHFTKNIPMYQTVGDLKEGMTFDHVSFNELWDKFLYPYMKPTISVSSNPSSKVCELGVPIQSVILNCNVTLKSHNISKVEFLRGSSVINTQSDNHNGGKYTYTESNPVTSTTTFKTRVTDAANKSYDNTNSTFTFVHPMYVGLVDNIPTESIIKSLTKKVQTPSNYTFTTSPFSNKRLCIACPPGWEIKQMKDGNGFDNTASFTKIQVQITCTDGSKQSYNVYYNNLGSSEVNFTMIYYKK